MQAKSANYVQQIDVVNTGYMHASDWLQVTTNSVVYMPDMH